MTDGLKAYLLQDMELFGAEYVIKKLYNIDPDILTYRTYMDYIEDGTKEAEYRDIYQSIIKHVAKDVSLIEPTIDAVSSNGDTIEGAAEYNGLEFFFHSYMHDGMESHEESAASCYIGTIVDNITNKKHKEERAYA